jgi:sugar/nucleoside kinase (ribokinase family)
MMAEIMTIGNMLVEVMRTGLDMSLDQPGAFVGPFPSGDTPIYADTAARLGHQVGFIGVIGADDFGKCLFDRFQRDGVDTAGVHTLEGYTTGTAFVAYFSGGSRKFIYHWRHAAAGQLAPEHVRAEFFQDCRWLHLTGCNIAVSESARAACFKAMQLAPQGARVSFDANLRPEILTVDQIRQLVQPVVDRADVILPSLAEAAMLTGKPTDDEGCRSWARMGKTVVLKMGAEGCRIYQGEEMISVPGFDVNEVDPTGAGDSFCAAFTVAMLEGMELQQAGRFANAVGALAVTKQGPMEGAPSRREVEAFLAKSSFLAG